MINKTPTIVKKAEKSSTMKKLLFFLLVLTGMVQKAWADTTVTTESDLKSAVQTSQTVTLGQDITLTTTGRLDINGTTVTLDLNGHTLKRPMAAADAGGQVIAVKDGGKLTISDSSGNNSGKITGGWAYQGGAIYVYEGCSLTINGGTISGNRSDKIEGEGTNYGYEAGRFANIHFSYNEAQKELTISDREGEFPGMLQKRTFIVVPVGAKRIQGYDPEAKGIEVQYDGKAQVVKL